MKKIIQVSLGLCALIVVSMYTMDWSAWEKISKNAEQGAQSIRNQIAKDMESVEWRKKNPYWNTLVDQYNSAVNTIKTGRHDNALQPLTTITPGNQKLVRNPLGHIRMTSLMPEWAVDTFYRPALQEKAGEFSTPTYPGVYLWVTAYPQLKNFITNYKSQKSELDIPALYRIQQYLGLPPRPGKFYFVDLWVNPKQLFRPCPDPEITDTTCVTDMNIPGISLPPGHPYKEHNIYEYIQPSEKHQEWYNQQIKTAYDNQSLMFPWTRFGYTYDWSKSSKNNVGTTEFVIKQNTPIQIISITPFDQY